MKTVILAGGSGTRLFPLSRENYPKQFIKIADESSLLQKTFNRCKHFTNSKDIFIVSGDKYQFHIKNQLEEIGEKDFKNIILEPVGRNTAPAIALAVKYLLEKENATEDSIIFITPSDHIISPEEKFSEYIKEAEVVAKEGYIVTFGVRPSKPETGYGYIEADEKKILNKGYKVKKFHEKPDLKTAQTYLLKGNFFWNSGMFMFSIKTILNEFKNHSPDIYSFIEKLSYEELVMSFSDMPDISIDYAVMEKSKNIAVIPVDIVWSDVGSWDSLYDVLDKDNKGNAKVGNVVDIDTENSLVFGDSKRIVSTIGLKDLIIVDTDDVVLIAKRGESQKVREIVKKFKEDKKLEEKAKFHNTVYRPWGSYTELEVGNRYKIKRITVKPGGKLSLQMHYHRSEHWVVIKGTAKVILENEEGKLEEKYIHENESIFVPKTTKHRLINPGKVPLEIIEVQVGEYVGEDDIVRFDDIYSRI